MDSLRRSVSSVPTSGSALGGGATSTTPGKRASGLSVAGLQNLERPISKTRGEISHSAFAFLFSEIVQYAYNRVSSIEDLQARLQELGFGVGQRLIEMIGSRERLTKRETRILGILQFVTTTVWRHLFGKQAETLERAMENEDECAWATELMIQIQSSKILHLHPFPADMIHESNPITNTFISVPPDLGQLDCGAYLAGIIAGILDSTKFVRNKFIWIPLRFDNCC
jgi:trafficking protein particle complex subunit 5